MSKEKTAAESAVKEAPAKATPEKKPESVPVSKSLQRARSRAANQYIFKLAGTLLGISVVVALLLGIVNSVTEPIITAAQAAKTQAAMAQVLEAKHYVRATEEEWELSENPNFTALYAASNDDGYIGYVVEVTATGFGGTISMVVGVDLDGKVTGVQVTNQSETANIGSKVVTDQSVLDRFIGMSHADGEITVNSGSNRFDGISGATVSSRGVTSGVNTALSVAEQVLANSSAQ